MAEQKVSDEELIHLFKEYGSPKRISEITGLDVTAVYRRRGKIERKRGIVLDSFRKTQKDYKHAVIENNRRSMRHELEEGMVIVGSDAHYWPGESTVAHQAFVKLIKKFKPAVVVLNGDVFDGARVSRHEPMYGIETPTVQQEIDACEERLDEIFNASKNSLKVWTLGNHDIRIFRMIATKNPELIETVDLFSYFPGWKVVWRFDVNDDLVIKHRWHNGIHATYNNTLKSGRSVVTGHLHKLQITPFSDYNGRRVGVDTGTLAEPLGEQFAYTEGNPVNWCSGFAVLTIKGHRLLQAELCEVINGKAIFRGAEV
jgi:hypothetical protein